MYPTICQTAVIQTERQESLAIRWKACQAFKLDRVVLNGSLAVAPFAKLVNVHSIHQNLSLFGKFASAIIVEK